MSTFFPPESKRTYILCFTQLRSRITDIAYKFFHESAETRTHLYFVFYSTTFQDHWHSIQVLLWISWNSNPCRFLHTFCLLTGISYFVIASKQDHVDINPLNNPIWSLACANPLQSNVCVPILPVNEGKFRYFMNCYCSPRSFFHGLHRSWSSRYNFRKLYHSYKSDCKSLA